MGEVEKRLKELGISLPKKYKKGEGVLPLRRFNDLLFISGHGPLDENNKPVYRGRVGSDLSVEEGYKAARLCGINILATIKNYIGDLDRIDYIVKVLGFVNSANNFTDQPIVMNGFSDLMVEILGERGKHARSAVGALSLPDNIPVEVEVIVKIRLFLKLSG